MVGFGSMAILTFKLNYYKNTAHIIVAIKLIPEIQL